MVVLSNLEFENSKKVGNIYVKGKCLVNGKNVFAFKGELYPENIDVDELFKKVLKDKSFAKKIKGEFFYICYEHGKNSVFIGNDKFGRETLFYFYGGKRFVISDDFWEIINIIKPEEKDFNVQAIKEQAVFVGGPLLYKTIINNLFFLTPSSIAEYSLKSNKFKINQYFDFKYKEEKITLDEAVLTLDKLFDSAMKQIKNKAGDVVYGLGLSGGMDSRLIASYAAKNNLKLKPFILGEKRPRKILVSRDHASSRKLAKLFGLKLIEIPYNSDSYENKSFYDIRYYPMGPSQIFITNISSLPKFDAVLTGMYGGEIFGFGFKPDINKMDKNEFLEFLFSIWSYLPFGKRLSKFQKFLVLLGKIKSKTMIREEIPGIINRKEYQKMMEQLESFVKSNPDKNNLNLFQKFMYFTLIGKNKYGFFSSMHGQKKSFASIFFNPYVVEYSLSWPNEFLINQNLQTYFYLKKFPELAKVKAQNYNVSLFDRKKDSFFRKIFAGGEFFLRGGVSLRYNYWATHDLNFRKFSRKVLLRENKFFNKIFDLNRVFRLGGEDGKIYENIVKIKKILDIIENKEYKNFISDSEKTSSFNKA